MAIMVGNDGIKRGVCRCTFYKNNEKISKGPFHQTIKKTHPCPSFPKLFHFSYLSQFFSSKVHQRTLLRSVSNM